MKILNQFVEITQQPHKHPIKKSSMFCPICGEGLYGFEIKDKLVCSYCRWEVDADDNYCYRCGTDTKDQDATEYWCNNNKLEKNEFTNLIEALNLDRRKVK